MKLIAIGFLGHYDVYVDVSKEEAIARYNAANPTYTVEGEGLAVREIEVKDGHFEAYDIWDNE